MDSSSNCIAIPFSVGLVNNVALPPHWRHKRRIFQTPKTDLLSQFMQRGCLQSICDTTFNKTVTPGICCSHYPSHWWNFHSISNLIWIHFLMFSVIAVWPWYNFVDSSVWLCFVLFVCTWFRSDEINTCSISAIKLISIAAFHLKWLVRQTTNMLLTLSVLTNEPLNAQQSILCLEHNGHCAADHIFE